MMLVRYCLLTLLVFTTGILHAQERAAGSSVDVQMSWSALSTMVNAVDTKTTAVNSRVDQIVLCSKKGMVYAPGAAGIDADGCLNPKNSDLVDKIILCGDTGLIYDKPSDTCIKGVVDVKVPSCATDIYKVQNSTGNISPALAQGYSCTLYNSYIEGGGTHSRDKHMREYICVRTRCS